MKGLGEAILGALDQTALPDAFERVTETRWVGASVNGVRGVFEFAPLKGGVHSARWGFSVDFVPRLVGCKLSWKRGAEKASFDLVIDPIDEAGSVPKGCSWNARTDDARRVARISRAAMAEALRDLNPITSPSDLLRLFEARSRMRFRRFSLDDYVQTHLAWGLVLVAVGRAAEGERHIGTFCRRYDVDPTAPILQEARNLAGAAFQAAGRTSNSHPDP